MVQDYFQHLLDSIERLTIMVEGKPDHDLEVLKEWCVNNLGEKYYEWACSPDTTPKHRAYMRAPVHWFFRTPEAAAEFTLTWS